MILPILTYGNPILRQKATDVDKDYPGLKELIENMFETMYNAQGAGLAAPQVGLSLKIFVVDATPFRKDEKKLEGFKKVFINPVIVEKQGKEWLFNEGCLSFPEIRENIWRKPVITIKYYDENLISREETHDGIAARIIQHEYDHTEGIVFIDHITPFKRRIIRGKLNSIKKGQVRVDYKTIFPANKQKSFN